MEPRQRQSDFCSDYRALAEFAERPTVLKP
jgi:hypothetical protein